MNHSFQARKWRAFAARKAPSKRTVKNSAKLKGVAGLLKMPIGEQCSPERVYRYITTTERYK